MKINDSVIKMHIIFFFVFVYLNLFYIICFSIYYFNFYKHSFLVKNMMNSFCSNWNGKNKFVLFHISVVLNGILLTL